MPAPQGWHHWHGLVRRKVPRQGQQSAMARQQAARSAQQSDAATAVPDSPTRSAAAKSHRLVIVIMSLLEVNGCQASASEAARGGLGSGLTVNPSGKVAWRIFTTSPVTAATRARGKSPAAAMHAAQQPVVPANSLSAQHSATPPSGPALIPISQRPAAMIDHRPRNTPSTRGISARRRNPDIIA